MGIVQLLGEKYSFSEAFPSKGYFGYCGRKLPTWKKEMCSLALLPIHAGVSDTQLTPQNHISMLWRRCWPQIKSWEQGGLSGGLSQPLVHLLNSRLFQFYQFCLICLCIKEANGKKKKKSNTQFLLTSGVSSANVTRESSCKGYEAKGKSLTKYGAGPKSRD